MSRITRPPVVDKIDYPTGDGKPMAESDVHLLLMLSLIPTLREFFKPQPLVYVGGNMLVFYERGNKRKHVSPDVFVVRGVPKEREPRRRAYLVWEEGRAPDFVVEFTSESTRVEDLDHKMAIYRDELRVREYFLFDPFAEHLDPALRGYRLVEGAYQPISPVERSDSR